MKASLEIVRLTNDVVTESPTKPACQCFDSNTPGSELCPIDE